MKKVKEVQRTIEDLKDAFGKGAEEAMRLLTSHTEIYHNGVGGKCSLCRSLRRQVGRNIGGLGQ